MECTLKESINFCSYCGAKLHENCQCWVKRHEYNCGYDKCPRYNLFALERQKEKPKFCYIDTEQWRKCQNDFTLNDFIGKECVVGIGWLNKLELASIVFEFKKNGEYYAIQNAFTPSNKDIIKGYVKNMEELFNIRTKEIVYDPYGAYKLANDMEKDGYVMVECRQGFSILDDPMHDLDKNIHNRTFHHNGDSILSSSIENMVVKENREGLIMPDREKSAANISPALALINAHARAMYVL